VAPGASLTEDLLALARAARGFMPDDEGLALHHLALERLPHGPVLEVGGYCGKSAVYLGAAARALGRGVVFSVDHHRGSEENQAGWEHHDASLVDARTGRIDTLPFFRRTIEDAGLEDVVVAVVGDSATVAARWGTPLSLLFVDGGHGEVPAQADYSGWAPWVMAGGLLAIHDVFPDPADGGRPPYDVYLRALASGAFEQRSEVGSLRVLERVSGASGEDVG
jgi:MMP 1-O-methyltransferase